MGFIEYKLAKLIVVCIIVFVVAFIIELTGSGSQEEEEPREKR